MGFYNIWLVKGENKMKRVKYINLLFYTIILVAMIGCTDKSSNIKEEKSYKPLLKVNSYVYGETENNYICNEKDLKLVGVVEKSYESGLKPITLEDENLTSNVFQEGLEVYTEKNTSNIVIKTGPNRYSKLEKIE